MKVAVRKLALETGLGDLGSFALLDNDGWTAPGPGDLGSFALLDNDGWLVASTAIDATSTEVDTEYGSAHRANMMQSRLLQEDGSGGIELTLVYNAGRGGSVLPACAPPILRKASETAV